MVGDTFALDFISLDFIQIWLKYAQNRYSLSIYQTGEGVPPTIIHYSIFIIQTVQKPKKSGLINENMV